MKGGLKKYIFIGIFFAGILSVGLLYGLIVYGETADNIYILTMHDQIQTFHDTDAACLQKEKIVFSFAQPVVAEVSNGFRVDDISVCATNENYAYFAKTQIKQGSFFNEIQVNRKLKLAVITETAAYQLFGNTDCMEQIIMLNDVPYEISGIVKEREKEACIYIPYTTIADVGAGLLDLKQVWCVFENQAEVALVLKKMGYTFDMVDVVKKGVL